MIIDISIFGFVRFYFALMCPWRASAIRSSDGTGWEYCSLHLSTISINGLSLGWAWDTDTMMVMFGRHEYIWC